MDKKTLPFGFDRPEDSPGFLLWQTTMLWQRLVKKALEPHNISHPQFVIMATVLWFGTHDYDITQVSIVNWTKLDKMTVSKSLKKLMELGMVNRAEHESDTRAKTVSLTKNGKAMVRKLVPIVEKLDGQFFSSAKANDQKALVKIMRLLIAGN